MHGAQCTMHNAHVQHLLSFVVVVVDFIGVVLVVGSSNVKRYAIQFMTFDVSVYVNLIEPTTLNFNTHLTFIQFNRRDILILHVKRQYQCDFYWFDQSNIFCDKLNIVYKYCMCVCCCCCVCISFPCPTLSLCICSSIQFTFLTHFFLIDFGLPTKTHHGYRCSIEISFD